MKKFLVAGLVLGVALVFVTIALPALISSEAVRSSLLQKAREITGREMIFRGDPSVSLSPFLGVEIQDVEFRSGHEDGDPILTMPTLKGRLSLASALRGQVDIDEFQFVRPVFDIDIALDGATSWAFPEGEVWQILEEARKVRNETETGQTPDVTKVPRAKLGRFTILDGLVNIDDARNGRSETISNLNGSLIWPHTRAPWEFNGNGIWRGDTVDVNMTSQSPIMLLAGGRSPISATIKSEPINLSFNGEANRLADLFFVGEIKASSPSLRRTINFFGGDTGTGASFSDFTAQGKVSGTVGDMQLLDGVLGLDGNEYSGSLRISASEDGKNRVSGTLATETMNAAPYLVPLGSVDGMKSLFRILDDSEMDIRLSSNNVTLGELSVTDFAGGLIATEDDFKLDIGNANIGNSIIVGNLTASSQADSITIGTEVNASNIDISQFSGVDKFSALYPVGVSNVAVKLSSEATEGGLFATNLSGNFSMAMKEGALIGLDFSQLRTSLDGDTATVENIQIGEAAGRTPIREFVLNADISRGVAWVADSTFLIEEFKSRISGKADLRSGNLAIWGLLEKPNEEGELQSHSQYFLGGTLAQPLYVPQLPGRPPVQAEKSTPETEQNAPVSDNTN